MKKETTKMSSRHAGQLLAQCHILQSWCVSHSYCSFIYVYFTCGFGVLFWHSITADIYIRLTYIFTIYLFVVKIVCVRIQNLFKCVKST